MCRYFHAVSLAFWDGLGAAIVSSVASTALALYVLRRTLRETRDLSAEQRRSDAVLLDEQVRANRELTDVASQAQHRLARELASREAARVCATSLAELLIAIRGYSAWLVQQRGSDPRSGALPLVEAAADYAAAVTAYAPALVDAQLADTVFDSSLRIDDFCGAVVVSAAANAAASAQPDSAEAASLTVSDRTWQAFITELHRMAEEVDRTLSAVRTYQAGRSWPPPSEHEASRQSDPRRQRGLAALSAWSGTTTALSARATSGSPPSRK